MRKYFSLLHAVPLMLISGMVLAATAPTDPPPQPKVPKNPVTVPCVFAVVTPCLTSVLDPVIESAPVCPRGTVPTGGLGCQKPQIKLTAVELEAIASGKRIYRCEAGYDPPCRLVEPQPNRMAGEETDWAELLAANRAIRTGAHTAIIRGDGPIAECGRPGHGGTGCCHKIATIILEGKEVDIVECG